MRPNGVNYLTFKILIILISLFFISGTAFNAAGCTTSCIGTTCQVCGNTITPETPVATNAWVVASSTSGLTYSPTTLVNSTNYDTAPWLLTCPVSPPQTPSTYSSGTGPATYFYTGAQLYDGGDTCGWRQPVLKTDFALYATITPGTYLQLADISFSGFQILDGGYVLNLTNEAFSPMVDSAISSGFSTNTYVFQKIPSYVQRGIWTWNVEWPNFSNATIKTPATTNRRYDFEQILGPVSICVATTTVGNVTTCTQYQDNYSYCVYDYTYTPVVSLSNLNNYYLPYTYVDAKNPTGPRDSFTTNFLPIFAYNVSMPSTVGYFNSTQDLFSPWHYDSPWNTIDEYPIDIGSTFFSAYNGVLTTAPTNDFTLQWAALQNQIINIKAQNIQPVIANELRSSVKYNPAVPNIISISGLPNDYVYVLNGTQDSSYYISIFRIIPQGSYTNVTTASQSAYLSQTTTDPAQFQTNWNAYWANVIDSQNVSVYKIKTIPLSSLSSSTFTPLGMAVDDNGNVYLTGNTFNSTSYYDGYDDTIPAFVNVTGTLSSSSPAIGSPTTMNVPTGNVLQPEITVSQDGKLMFVANQTNDGGTVLVYDSNTTYVGAINLAFQQGISLSSGQPTSALNITYWLENNGLFNQSIPWISGYLNSYTPQNTLGLDVPDYHHPVAISYQNGYLYVLDDWSGVLDYNTNPGWFFAYGSTYGGIWFNILMLRGMNSSGASVPMNPNLFPDMYNSGSCDILPSGTPVDQCMHPLSPKPTCSPSTSCKLITTVYNNYRAPTCVTYVCASNVLSADKVYSSLAASGTSFGATYPPYGWILAANITAGKLNNNCGWFGCTNFWHFPTTPPDNPSIGSASGGTVSFCGVNSGSYACDFSPKSLPNMSSSPYIGAMLPIGPHISALNTVHDTGGLLCQDSGAGDVYLQNGGSNSYDEWSPFYHNVSFSVNYNSTLDLLLPNYTYGVGGGAGCNANERNPNFDTELLFTKLSVANYTNVFNGGPSVCYTNSSTDSSPSSNCQYLPALQYITSPTFTEDDPFAYLENLGGPQIPSYSGYLAAYFSGTNGQNVANNKKVADCANSLAQNGFDSAACGAYNLTNITASSVGILSNLPTITPGQPETIRTNVSGSVIIPYTYTYSISQSWTGFTLNSILTHYTGPVGGLSCTTNPVPPDQSSTGTPITEYSFYYNPTQKSNDLYNVVEGGFTYLQGMDNIFYKPNLSDVGLMLPPQDTYDIENNRYFGSAYINVTTNNLHTSSYTAIQYILNATFNRTYSVVSHMQGILPGYNTIASSLVPIVYGNTAAEDILQNPSVVNNFYAGTNELLSYQQRTANLYPNIFNFFYSTIYLFNETILMNGTAVSLSSGGPPVYSLLGYNRLVYVFKDRFNNTIYAPIDADISNATQIALTTSAVVDLDNTNQTVISVNGLAGYTYSGKFYAVPTGSPIYLYYDQNINFAKYNSIVDPTNTQYCAFGANSSSAPINCTLADPIISSLSKNANTITYNASYNVSSSGNCYPPAGSFFAVPPLTCNINGAGLPQTCPIGTKQTCVPEFANGTGICTTQMGLISIVPTAADGSFHDSLTACGTGNAEILAWYYGATSPEPTSAVQTPLSLSSAPVYNCPSTPPYSPCVNTYVFNYVWAPTFSASFVKIGLLLLAFGNINTSSFLIIVLAILMIFIYRRSK